MKCLHTQVFQNKNTEMEYFASHIGVGVGITNIVRGTWYHATRVSCGGSRIDPV